MAAALGHEDGDDAANLSAGGEVTDGRWRTVRTTSAEPSRGVRWLQFVADTSCPSAAAYRSRSWAMVNVSGPARTRCSCRTASRAAARGPSLMIDSWSKAHEGSASPGARRYRTAAGLRAHRDQREVRGGQHPLAGSEGDRSRLQLLQVRDLGCQTFAARWRWRSCLAARRIAAGRRAVPSTRERREPPAARANGQSVLPD